MQSDLIGLEGGISTYGYANQNPVKFVDPLGLVSCDGRWVRVSFRRSLFFNAFTNNCVCSWSCYACPASGVGDAFPYPNVGQFTTNGKGVVDASGAGAGFDLEGANECICAKPGPEKDCKKPDCDQK